MKQKNILIKILSIVTVALSSVLLILIHKMNIIPGKFFVPILMVLFVLNFMNVFLSFINTKKFIKIVQIIISIILSIVSVCGSFYLIKTISFMNNLGDNGFVTQNYSLVVLKESSYEQMKDLKNKYIGVLKNDSRESEVIDYLNSNIESNIKELTDLFTFKESLYKKEMDAIVIEDSYKALLEEIDSEFVNKTKTIHTFSLEFESEDISKSVDVTKDPFAIYISGIDTYGNISSVSRSDVNIVAVINPNTYQVLLISIPRDYYIQLHDTTGYKDKLTHAGMYGVDMSVQTIEDLLDMDINYYLKVNFTSLIDIVDALGGIDVYSEYSFDSEVGYYFYKGYNHINGEQTLAFARARHAFIDGDRQRGKNQQAVIAGIIKKVASKAIISKYDSLLTALNGKFQTNLEINEITSLAKLQLDKMPSWNIKSISLNGSDSSNYTYTYSSGKLYVMEPDLNSINDAKNNIEKILNGEKLDSSYGEASNIKNPGIVENSPQTPEVEENLSLSLSSNDITVKIGEIIQILAQNTSTDVVSWKSSNPDVATVSENGTVSPISEGITTITASISGTTATCIVRVINPLDTILPDQSDESLENEQNTPDDDQNINNNEDNIVDDNINVDEEDLITDNNDVTEDNLEEENE